MGVADLALLLEKYDWGKQLNVLDYMRKFQTWDALYDDLELHLTESLNPEIRNVTPEKPKLLGEHHE